MIPSFCTNDESVAFLLFEYPMCQANILLSGMTLAIVLIALYRVVARLAGKRYKGSR